LSQGTTFSRAPQNCHPERAAEGSAVAFLLIRSPNFHVPADAPVRRNLIARAERFCHRERLSVVPKSASKTPGLQPLSTSRRKVPQMPVIQPLRNHPRLVLLRSGATKDLRLLHTAKTRRNFRKPVTRHRSQPACDSSGRRHGNVKGHGFQPCRTDSEAYGL
jgi:hypothetical protein